MHVLIKAGGLGCTGWGGGSSPQRANTPHVTFGYFYVKVVVFFFTYIAIKRSFEDADICVCTTVIIPNKVSLN